jgi:acetoin utilization protein AcuB
MAGRVRRTLSSMQVQELMTEAPVTIRPTETVRSALLRMEDQEIRHLPVVEGKRLVGVVSDRDLREYRLPIMQEIDNPQLVNDLFDTPVGEVMNAAVVTLDTGETIMTAIDLILEYGVGALPVVDRDQGTLVGIVSYVDVLRYLRSTL